LAGAFSQVGRYHEEVDFSLLLDPVGAGAGCFMDEK
jgi:hypothetical protein